MIFRREPSTTFRFDAPPKRTSYTCETCDVAGIGAACWCCGSTEVTIVPSLWVGTRGPAVSQ